MYSIQNNVTQQAYFVLYTIHSNGSNFIHMKRATHFMLSGGADPIIDHMITEWDRSVTTVLFPDEY